MTYTVKVFIFSCCQCIEKPLFIGIISKTLLIGAGVPLLILINLSCPNYEMIRYEYCN